MFVVALSLLIMGMLGAAAFGFMCTCIRRGFGHLKGAPLPVGWWQEG